MRMVKQRGLTDCGIACAAMICQSTYKQAEWAFNDIWRDKDKGLNTRQMCDGIKLLGPMHPFYDRLIPWNYDAVVALIGRGHTALLKIIDHNTRAPRRNFHWCVFNPDNGYIYDPAGEIIPNWQIQTNILANYHGDPEVTHYVEFH
jgi:hypothetical protein